MFHLLRDIYYEDVEFYGSQGVVDSAVLKLTRILGVPRHVSALLENRM